MALARRERNCYCSGMSERDECLAAAGARLRRWRTDNGLSQAAAGERIKASQGAWAAWERGDKGPDLHYAFELERLTGGDVLAEAWAFPRRGSKASPDESGEHAAVSPDTGTGTEG